MNQKELAHQQSLLKAEIARLRRILTEVEHKTRSFEAELRYHLANELIEEQELSMLYKQQKQEKKARRLEQRKKGKRYVEPAALSVKKEQVNMHTTSSEADEKEKKRLYREAMLHVHPDKFSMDEDKMERATEVTARLIEIYKTESLSSLQTYHAHLFSNAGLTEAMAPSAANVRLTASDDYLLRQKEQLERQLAAAKKRHTYYVLETYENPLSYVDELKAYYQDRIRKLRKRTRKTKG